MKKFKKILSLTLALAMSAAMAAPAFADTLTVSVDGNDILGSTVNVDAADATVETTIQPEVLVFRDYEDYTNGSDPFNGSTTYGIYGVSGTAQFYKAATVKNGADGNGIQFNTRTSNGTVSGTVSNGNLLETLTSGILYIAVDVAAKTDAEFDAQDGTVDGIKYTDSGEVDENGDVIYTESKEGHQNFIRLNAHSGGMYLRFATQHSANTDLGDGSGTTVHRALIDSNSHRIEWVIDLSGDKATAYIDGVQVNQSDCSLDISTLQIQVTNGIGYWDNFTVVHYPENYAKTFSVVAKDKDYVNNALIVDFDSNTKTVTDTAEYTANYPVFVSGEVTTDTFTVTNTAGEAVAVSSVTPADAFGSYKIVLADGFVEGETYTISVATGLTDIYGATIDTTATATFSIATPNVLLYRDYEDYTSGADLYNRYGTYGSWVVNASTGFAKNALKAVGNDGVAVTTPASTGNGSWKAKFAEPLTAGKFYVAYDIEKKSDEEYIKMYGETPVCVQLLAYLLVGSDWADNVQMNIRTSVSHSSITTGLSSYKNCIANYYLGEGYTRIEYVIDLDADMIYRYINGELEASQAFTSDLYGYAQGFSADVKYFDNFTMLHIPNDTLPLTFSLQDAKVDKNANKISVRLRSDIKNAAYPIVTEEFTEADFVVTDGDGAALTINNVAKGAAFGEYVITVEEALVEGEVYTVTAVSEKTDILGAALDLSKTAYVESDIWHDYDFEDSAKPSGWENTGTDARVQVDMGKYGKGMALTSGKTALETFVPKQTINKGVVNISFDYMDDERAGQEHLSFNNDINRVYVFYMRDENKFRMGKDSLAGYGDANKSAEFEDGTLYHLDLVFDFDNLKYKAYVNGKQIATSTLSSSNNIQNTYWAFNNTYFFDNFKMAKVLDDSFKIQKATWNGDYAEVLLSEGASEAAHALTADKFTVVDVATGAAVTPKSVEVVGRRVIFEGLDSSKDYKITLPEGYANFLGTALVDREVTIEGVEFTVTDVKVTADENGTELTADMIANLKVGDKVYAEVTYVNPTGIDQTFVLIGATYSDSRMTNVNLANITALGSVSNEVKAYVEITVNNIENFKAKAFALKSIESMIPLK